MGIMIILAIAGAAIAIIGVAYLNRNVDNEKRRDRAAGFMFGQWL